MAEEKGAKRTDAITKTRELARIQFEITISCLIVIRFLMEDFFLITCCSFGAGLLLVADVLLSFIGS